MILERLGAAIKSAGLGWSLGCAYVLTGVFLWNRFGWIELWLLFVMAALGFIIGFAVGGKTPDQLRMRTLRRIHRECVRSGHGLEVAESTVLRVGPDVTTGERARGSIAASFGGGDARVDHLQVVRVTAPQGDFHLVIPWSGPNPLLHEFFSWMNGHLPAALTLRRGALGSWSSGRWVGPRGEPDHPVARAAEAHPADLNSGIEWNWEKGDLRIELDWGVQAVPVCKDWYIHVIQTAPHAGLVRSSFGLDWYVSRWVAFFLFVRDLKLDGKQEKIFLFQPRALFVFHRQLGTDAEAILPLTARVTRPAKVTDIL